jgi:hypothetical protein
VWLAAAGILAGTGRREGRGAAGRAGSHVYTGGGGLSIAALQ